MSEIKNGGLDQYGVVRAGHRYQRQETSDKDFPRHLHRAAGLSKDSRDVCQDDPTS